MTAHLKKGMHDWMHVLGTGKLEWAGVLTAISNVVYANSTTKTLQLVLIALVPATSNGQQYTHYPTPHNGKWKYAMEDAPDDKAYWNNTTI